MKRTLILCALLLSVSTKIFAQNKSFTASFDFQIFTAGQTVKMSKPIIIEYNKKEKTLSITAGNKMQPYDILGSSFEFGALKLRTDAGVYVVTFAGGEIQKITWFTNGLSFKTCYSTRPVVLNDNPVFGSND